MCAPSKDARGSPVSYASPSRTSTCVSPWPATKPRANSTKCGLRSMPRTEPVGPTRLPSRCRTPPGPQPRSTTCFAWPDPYSVELGVGVGREIGNLAFEPCLLSFRATKQIVVRLRHGTFLSSRARGCGLTFARMRQPLRAVNRNKADLRPRSRAMRKTFRVERRQRSSFLGLVEGIGCATCRHSSNR